MSPASRGRAIRIGALALSAAALAVLSACTSARTVAQRPPTVPRTTVHSAVPSSTPPARTTSASAPPVTPTPSRTHRHKHRHPSSPATTSKPASTVASRTTAPPPSSSSSASPSTCRNVTIRLIRGGAAQGTEIAALQYTNSGSKPCALGDYPQVMLLRHQQQIGSPSQPQAGTSPRTVQLNPGETAQSLLRDYSTCQAPLSDNARVSVPGENQTAVRPAELRACTLRVGPLTKQR